MYRTTRFATSKGLWLFLFRQSFELGSGECKYHNELGQKPVTLLLPTLGCLRIAKEIAMVCGIFVEGRRQILLYSCK